MDKLAYYNKLPPKQSYVEKAKKAVRSKPGSRQIDVIRATKLTKTQALCALEELIKTGVIHTERKGGVPVYFISEDSNSD